MGVEHDEKERDKLLNQTSEIHDDAEYACFPPYHLTFLKKK